MEGVPVAARDCPGIRYLRGLSKRIQSIGYSPWTGYPKASGHSHLVHLPQTPVLQSGPVVDLGLKDFSIGCSEEIDVNCKLNKEVSNSFISLPSNSDLQSVSTIGPASEKTTSRCSETANIEEILTCLRSHGILICDPDPRIILKPVHRPTCTVPADFEPLTSSSTHRYLRCLYPRPTCPSVCNKPQGLEPLSSTVEGIVHLDTGSNIEFDLGSKSQYPRQVHVSGSPMSIDSNTTDSDGISEPEIIRDITRLARTAVFASDAEVQQSLDQLLFTKFKKVLNNSESSDSDGKWDFVRAEGNPHLGHIPYKIVLASRSEFAPHLASSDSPDSENLCEAEGRRDLVDIKFRTAALGSGKEVFSEQSSISFSYSVSNSDSTDSDVLSDLDKRSFKNEVNERATGSANLLSGALAGVAVAEEPKTRGADCEDPEAALQPEKQSFKSEVKEIASDPANSSTGARAALSVADDPKSRRVNGKDSGGALYPNKRSFIYKVKESARGHANTSIGVRAGSLVAEERKTRRTDYKDFGAALYHKRSFKHVVKESGFRPANSSAGARAGVLVAQEPNTRGKDCNDSGAALPASTSEGVASRSKLNPNAKEFVPNASKSGSLLVPNAKEFVPRAFKSGDLAGCGPVSPRLQKVQLFGVELTRSSTEAKANARAISAPGDSHLDLGTALRINHERKGWVKWSQTKEFVPSSDAEVVWGSGRGNLSTDKSALVQNLQLPSRDKSTTTPAQKFNGKRRPAS